MGAGIPPLDNLQNLNQNLNPNLIQITSNLSISTESAKILAKAFQDEKFFLFTIIGSISALISSLLAYLAIRQNSINQRDLLADSVHQRFFEINRDLASRRFGNKNTGKPLNQHELELLANYFDSVASLIKKGKIPFDESENFASWISSSTMTTFVTNYRTKNGQQYFDSLVWLKKEIQSRKKKPIKQNIFGRILDLLKGIQR